MRNNITAPPPFFEAVSLLLLRHPLELGRDSCRSASQRSVTLFGGVLLT